MAQIGGGVSPLAIERATPTDAAGIAAVHVASWQAAYAGILPAAYLAGLSIEERSTLWENALASGRTEVWLARRGGSLEGFVSLRCVPGDANAAGASGEIQALYVLERSWRSGAGRALCIRACDALQRQRCHSVELWVFAENVRARRFYESLGFLADEGSRQPFELGGIWLDEIRYRKPLGGRG